MSDQTIHISREELYEQVWSEPMITLAKRFGLSDVGLAKVCRKLEVPRPEQRGYWPRSAFVRRRFLQDAGFILERRNTGSRGQEYGRQSLNWSSGLSIRNTRHTKVLPGTSGSLAEVLANKDPEL
jgi:hypothetical protein